MKCTVEPVTDTWPDDSPGDPALGYLTPAEYAAGCRHANHPVTCDVN